MEDYDYILSDHSSNEEAYYSDQIDSDIEAELYGLIHHDAQDNSISLQDLNDSIKSNSVSLEDKPASSENNSVLHQNTKAKTDDNSVLPLNNSLTSEDTVNSTKNQKNYVKKKNSSTPVKTNSTDVFCSDAIVNDNLYISFESPVRKQKIQSNPVQSENLRRNVTGKPAKRKSDVVSEILGNIQLKKNRNSKLKSMPSENNISKLKKNKCDQNSTINLEDSFIEVVDDSSDSDGSIIFFEPDELNLETNIEKEFVVLSSDSGDSDSSMEKSFSYACQKEQTAIANVDVLPNNKDPWHINSEDKFRTKKQSSRYHENAVVTCSKCHLKGHSAKFCTVPKAMKCFFCGDYHSGMQCKNKICTRCFRLGHDCRRCYIRYVDTCELCRMRGHSEKNCPDIWRRYHLTTSKGSIVKGNLNPHSQLYCYNCGSKGHYGAECIENCGGRWNFHTWTSVISYKNPMSILQKEGERNFHERSKFDRTPETSNFNRLPETSRFNRIPETSNFNRAFERSRFNRTPETSNFNSLPETSRFDRMPWFHRRKKNETFSKDSPKQNIKKKKKKKSKTPPNTNHQSISNLRNAVQNDVYFPRTPKMTPSSSTTQLSKKKMNVLKKKETRHLRNQMMHRIGLQQRLGLPFPSTV